MMQRQPEKAVYSIFQPKREEAVAAIIAQMQNKDAAAYKDLDDEMKGYMDYVCDTVLTKNTGILNSDLSIKMMILIFHGQKMK